MFNSASFVSNTATMEINLSHKLPNFEAIKFIQIEILKNIMN